MMTRFIPVMLAGVLLSSCTMISSLERPNMPIPANYPEGLAYNADLSGEQEQSLHDIAWQNFFKDETLKALIAEGLNNNNDVKTAVLNISEARALYGIQRSDLIPDIEAGGGYTRQKLRAGRTSGATSATSSGTQDNIITENYSVNLGFTAYELDFFGRVQSLNEAALNRYLSSLSALETVRLTLIAEIASAYVSLRANQALLNLARETLQSRKESFDLIAKRLKEGVATDLELVQAETLLLQSRVDLFEYRNAVAQDMNALRLLMGTPQNMPDLVDTDADMDFDGFLLDVPAGMPADLLFHRPDIRQAEFLLYSANADIGAARAAFFPRISLTTSAGYRSGDLDDLFSDATQVWSFAPQIELPIFTGGRLKNNLDLAKIRKEKAVVEYESVIESAFRDVADSLSAVSTYEGRIEAQQNLVNAAKKRVDLSTLRYDSGVENYLAVLDSKREFYTARQNLVLQRAAGIHAKIGLYKSVGGGVAQ
ncbi:MAG: efflux transporter outer membrane subunit [Alphaproteobacteria bacterium]